MSILPMCRRFSGCRRYNQDALVGRTPQRSRPTACYGARPHPKPHRSACFPTKLQCIPRFSPEQVTPTFQPKFRYITHAGGYLVRPWRCSNSWTHPPCRRWIRLVMAFGLTLALPSPRANDESIREIIPAKTMLYLVLCKVPETEPCTGFAAAAPRPLFRRPVVADQRNGLRVPGRPGHSGAGEPEVVTAGQRMVC